MTDPIKGFTEWRTGFRWIGVDGKVSHGAHGPRTWGGARNAWDIDALSRADADAQQAKEGLPPIDWVILRSETFVEEVDDLEATDD